MVNYIIRRIGYGVLILIGVNIFTFMLFFTVNTPDDMARMNIGGKRVSQDAIEKWKVERGYDKPLFWNGAAPGTQKLTKTIFYDRSVQLFAFDFGASDSGRDIGYEIRQTRRTVDRARGADLHSRHRRRDRLLAADGVLPQHLSRVLGIHRRRSS